MPERLHKLLAQHGFGSRREIEKWILEGRVLLNGSPAQAGASYSAGDVEAMWRARDAQVPMGHMGDAWDVANAALFLASDESKYVTGIELVVDGGITVKS